MLKIYGFTTKSKVIKASEINEMIDLVITIESKIIKTPEEERTVKFIRKLVERWIEGEERKQAWQQKNTHTHN